MLKERDKVYLLIKNLKSKKNKQSSKKLDYIKNRQKRLVNYKLNLLLDTKVLSIFYILLLELVDLDILL